MARKMSLTPLYGLKPLLSQTALGRALGTSDRSVRLRKPDGLPKVLRHRTVVLGPELRELATLS
jgi:hypothetical protein